MDLAKSFKAGIFYTAVGKYSNVIIQLLVTAILSRLLSPKEYGIVAIINVFLIFFQMLAESGIGPAIIQIKTLSDKNIEHIFSFTFYIGLILSILFSLIGYPLSFVYQNKVYITISILLGICIFFYSLTIVPQALLSKRLDFKTINFMTILANVLSAIAGIFLAVAGFGVYALIATSLIKAILLFLFFYVRTKIPFSFKFEKTSIQLIMEFSKFQFLFNFLNYFARNLDNLLIGSMISPDALGYYDKAYQLSLYPNQVLSQIITPAIHPIMSNFSEDIDKMRKVFISVSRVMIVVGIPISTFLCLNAKEIIHIMFGSNWSQSVPVFQLLSLTIWLQMANSFLGSFFQATNNTKKLFIVGTVTSLVNVIAILIGIYLGSILTVASMLIISFVLVLMISLCSLKPLLRFSWKSYLVIIVKNITIVLPYILINYFISIDIGIIGNLVIQGIVFLVIWSIGLVVTKEFNDIKFLLRR